MINKFDVVSQDRYQLIDITSNIESSVAESGIDSGLIFIFTLHSTTAILITEDDSALKRDWLEFFKNQVNGIKFTHDLYENNADSHILSGIIGHEKTFMIENGKIQLGKWQQIFFVEFDGPKIRDVMIKITEG